MIKTTASSLREGYLARLDEEMKGLPYGVASEIRAGVLEELHGLGAEAMAAKISQVGDPVAIARGARTRFQPHPPILVTTSVSDPGPDRAAPRSSTTSTRGFAITAALTLSFGGIVIPLLGWFVGAVLVTLSALWKTWEKAVAIIIPFIVGSISLLLLQFISFESGSSSGSGSGTSAVDVSVDPSQPILGFLPVLLVLGLLTIPISGLWLIWRLRGRSNSDR